MRLAIAAATMVVGLVASVDVAPSPTSTSVVLKAEVFTPPSQRGAVVGAGAPQRAVPPARQAAPVEVYLRRLCPRHVYIIGLPCLAALPAPDQPAASSPAAGPEVTAGDVERAVREVGLPRLIVHIEPDGETLVNLPTNLYTDAEPFNRTVDVLGTPVRIRATAESFTWHHGDGTQQRTSSPGRPYPHLDVTHAYRDPGPVAVRVDVTYGVKFAIGDSPWQRLDAMITAEGRVTPLTVREAAPVLVRPDGPSRGGPD